MGRKAEFEKELNTAVDAAKRRDWATLSAFAYRHSGILASIVIPTILILRYPPAAIAMLRFLGLVASVTLQYGGQFTVTIIALSVRNPQLARVVLGSVLPRINRMWGEAAEKAKMRLQRRKRGK